MVPRSPRFKGQLCAALLHLRGQPMEIFNFSGAETKRINQALGFISAKEVDLDALLDRTLVVKTENYADSYNFV